MASQIPFGRSNQLSYERLVVSWAILLGYICHIKIAHIKPALARVIVTIKISRRVADHRH